MTDLLARHVEGRDYVIERRPSSTGAVVLAPHGGKIECLTSEIARASAGKDHGLYCFEGRLEKGNFDELHVTSEHYNEPSCLRLVTSADFAVAIHGLKTGDTIDVGGLNHLLQEDIVRLLNSLGFRAHVDRTSDHSGQSDANICNRGKRHGAQLEIPLSLRQMIKAQPDSIAALAAAVREAISAELARSANV